jgi:hypothetical protein
VSTSHTLAQYPVLHFRNLINSGNIYLFVISFRNHDTVVNIMTRLRAGRSRVRTRANERDFCSTKRPDRFWGTFKLSARWEPGLFLWRGGGGSKRRGSEADHSPPSSTEVKNECSYTSTPPICLQGVDRNFTCICSSFESNVSVAQSRCQ